ncbi:hypothetical protein E5D57_004584 [Metarhizium anisopliae]|nr:hypothetical protein E5D57_004584 [Metarhizium anisopliae]
MSGTRSNTQAGYLGVRLVAPPSRYNGSRHLLGRCIFGLGLQKAKLLTRLDLLDASHGISQEGKLLEGVWKERAKSCCAERVYKF